MADKSSLVKKAASVIRYMVSKGFSHNQARDHVIDEVRSALGANLAAKLRLGMDNGLSLEEIIDRTDEGLTIEQIEIALDNVGNMAVEYRNALEEISPSTLPEIEGDYIEYDPYDLSD